MNKRIFIAAILTMLLVACNNLDEPIRLSYERTPITFNAFVGLPSRGYATDLSALRSQGFDVYALTQNDRDGSTNKLYFPATTYTYSNISDEWTGERQFWPSEGKSLDMFFYAPAAAFDSINYAFQEAFFSINPSIDSQCDLLWAAPMTGLTSSTTTVTPHFAHALSRIQLSAYIDGDSINATSGGARISSVTISGDFNTQGTVDLAATSVEALWKDVTPYPTVFSPSIINTAITTTNENAPIALMQDGQEIFIIPTNFSDKKCRISVTFTYEGKSYTLKHDINVNFEAGQTYTLNLRLTKPGGITTPDITTDPSDPDEDNL